MSTLAGARLWRAALAAGIAAAIVAFDVAPAAQSTPTVQQQQQQPQQPLPQQQQQQRPPTFRTDVDVIRLDVSVLDRRRQPVRGLRMEDFQVFEDGDAQKIVAVTEVDAGERDPEPSAWMRHVAPDTTTNDLVDQLGDGRLYAILMDDWNVPWDDQDIIRSARQAARYVVDGLGPSDVAAVVYPRDAGYSVDFTSDRAKLLEAIDRFDPREPDRFILPTPPGTGGGGGDIPYRFSPALMRTQCERSQPAVPTLRTVASRMAVVPNRRKTLIFVTTGVPMTFAGGRGCPADLNVIMRDVFRIAREANINIYGIDPAGYRGYEQYLMNPIRRGGRPSASAPPPLAVAERAARVRREFLEIVADYTGAQAVVGSEGFEAGIDRIFEEDSSYYLVGYQSSNGKPDGKFRRVSVKVSRPDVTIRTRSGYFAPEAGSMTSREEKEAPTTNELNLSGMSTPVGLPLRASVAAVGPAAAGGRLADVAIVLSVRLPPVRNPLAESLMLIRNVYDPRGRTGAPLQQKFDMTVEPGPGDELRYDVFQHLTLEPGRYEIRLHGTSAVLGRSGTVFATVEVPDFTRAGFVMSSIVLGALPPDNGARTDPLAEKLPIVPTSARDFAPSDTVNAFVRLVPNVTAGPQPATVKVMILDRHDTALVEETQTVPVEAFGPAGAAFQFTLPLTKLTRGPHLLSVTATLPSGATARRDLVFRVR